MKDRGSRLILVLVILTEVRPSLGHWRSYMNFLMPGSDIRHRVTLTVTLSSRMHYSRRAVVVVVVNTRYGP